MILWLLNFLAFQIGWFACVLGGAMHQPWLGTGIALSLIGWHIWRAPQPLAELTLVLCAGLSGWVLDSVLVRLGLTRFPSGVLIEGSAPHWIVAMWMLFAITLNVSLRWLKGRWLVAAGLGAVGGPLAYYAGYKLDGVSFGEPMWLSLVVLAVVWAMAMPLLMVLSQRWDGMVIVNRQSASAGSPSVL